MNRCLMWVATTAASVCAQVVVAGLNLPAVFTDHMVVQQNRPVVVWGKAEAGETVTVTLAGNEATTRAGADGRFRLQLPSLVAQRNAGPHELLVRSPAATVRIRDVVVGEVWLCSGQSNMRLPVRDCANAKEEIASANYPDIRLFWVPDTDSAERQFTIKGAAWRNCSPKTVGTFSAAAYYFGRQLHKSLGVPVGLIDTSRGWSPIEAWLPMDLMAADPAVKPLIDRHRKLIPQLDDLAKAYDKELAAWKVQHAATTRQATQPIAAATTAPSTPKPRRIWGLDPRLRPEGLYNAMLVPLTPYQLAGVIWYQGESNVLRAEQYRVLLPMLIAHWRTIFDRPDLPFGIVQLPVHINGDIPFDSSWAELREAQLLTYRQTPNTGLAITMDIGEPRNIHPLNKQDVGKRLAAWAIADVYKKGGESTGPIFRTCTIDGGKARIDFDHIGKGLTGDSTPLKGFTIAGEDRKFHPADARIEGQSVVVFSPDVAKPVAVRYAWNDNPECSLRNSEGLPASPFRTDDWPLMTAGVSTQEWQ